LLFYWFAQSGTPVYYYTQERLNVRCARRLMALLPEELENVLVYLADSTADPDLFALLRAARREISTGVLILDGLELMVENRSPYPAANPFSEVHLRKAAAATVLNEFAKRCHLSVLAAVPLSRDTELRAGHRPTLSDVRYHRRFVDEADTVVLLYRDGYYSDAGKGSPQTAEWIVARNRFGPTGTRRVLFDAEAGRYAASTL
jgi:replicative DNA helicase